MVDASASDGLDNHSEGAWLLERKHARQGKSL